MVQQQQSASLSLKILSPVHGATMERAELKIALGGVEVSKASQAYLGKEMNFKLGSYVMQGISAHRNTNEQNGPSGIPSMCSSSIISDLVSPTSLK